METTIYMISDQKSITSSSNITGYIISTINHTSDYPTTYQPQLTKYQTAYMGINGKLPCFDHGNGNLPLS